MTEDLTERMTSRKFWLVVVIQLLATALLVGGYINAVHWEGVTQWILTAYVVSNLTQRWVERKQTHKEVRR